MRRIPLVSQHDEKDCAAAALSSILRFFGRKVPMAALRESLQVDQNGANAYAISVAAKENGLETGIFSCSAEELFRAVQEKAIPMPAILRIVNDQMFEHFVVVAGSSGGKLKLIDPSGKRCKMSVQQFQKVFLGEVILFEKRSDFKKENLCKGRFRPIRDLVLRQKKLIAWITAFSLLISGIGMSGTLLFQYLLDTVLPACSSASDPHDMMWEFASLLGILAAAYGVKLAVQLMRGKLLTAFSKRLDLPLILDFYVHMTELPIRFFHTRKSGEILTRFQDAEKIRDAISGVTLTMLIDVTMVIICGAFLYRTSSSLFSVAMVIFLLYLLVSWLYIRPLEKSNRNVMIRNDQFTSYLKETIDGMETVKTFQAEPAVQSKGKRLFRDLVDVNAKGSLLALSKNAAIDFITSVGMLVLLWAGAVNVIQGDLTAGTLLTFVFLLDYFLSPVENLLSLQDNLQTAATALQRLYDVMDLEEEQKSGMVPEEDLTRICMQDVCFRYGHRERVLNGISFSASRGQQIALVGESGSGKSTISKLLMGLYPFEHGDILVNGISIKDLSLRWLREQTACVHQMPFFFADTIRENLNVGLAPEKQLPDEDLMRLLDACCCGFVRDLPLGLDTPLEEGGCNLSQGQRQRLAIVQALLRKPRLLILDEATSALDTKTEHKIQAALSHYMPDAITVIIAHRLSTIRQSSQILVIHEGRVVERGTHPSLIQRDGLYADLWARQTVGE